MTAPLPSSNSSKYQNQTTVLTQLQNSVSSLNQSIAQLSNQVTSLNATIAVDNRVVNERGKLPTTTTAENASGAIEPAVSFAMSKRITGDLEKDDYIVLGHFANQSSAQIERQLQLKVPCDDDKQPKVKLLVGSISDTLTILDLGRAINKVSVEGSGEVTLSKPGDYCLYQAELPRDAADAILVNDSGGTLKLGDTRSYVTITNVISPTNY
jgi:hypothetical protein